MIWTLPLNIIIYHNKLLLKRWSIRYVIVDYPPYLVNLRDYWLHISVLFALKTLHYKRYRIPYALVSSKVFNLWPALTRILTRKLLLQTNNFLLLLSSHLPQNSYFLFSSSEIFLCYVISQLSFQINPVDPLLFPFVSRIIKLFFRNDNFVLLQYFFKLFNPQILPLQRFLSLFSNPIISTQLLIEMHVDLVPLV